MFNLHTGSTQVPEGTYLSLATGNYETVAAGGTLPGDEMTYFLRVNVLLMLILGPLSGLLFVIALPLLAPVFLAYVLFQAARKVTGQGPLTPIPATVRGR